MLKENLNDIGNRIRQVYEDRYGINKQVNLAKHLDISSAMLSYIFDGSIKISASRFFTICNYLNCKPSYLISGSDKEIIISEDIDMYKKFDNGEVRRVWQAIRKNSFPNYDRVRIKVEELADVFCVSDAYITYRDYEYSRTRQVTISLVDIINLCEVYNIPIDAIWCYLNGINF